MADALHSQTFVTYGMMAATFPWATEGRFVCASPANCGHKSVKFITRLTVTDSLKGFGKGFGSEPPEAGYAWYAGI